MQILIDVPEEVYKKAKETHDVMCDSVWLGIKYGTPLPKGHGRLIDADKLKHRYIASQGDTVDDKAWITAIRRSINEAPTIIEADKAESEVEE